MKRWFFPIERVEQEDDHGCGIASVATICGVTYARARAEFFPRRQKFIDDDSLHTSQSHLIDVIRQLGFSAVVKSHFRPCGFPGIFCFAWHPGMSYTEHHAVVWDPFAKKVIDPGYDFDMGHKSKFYLDLWKRSNFETIYVTGKRH